MFMGLDHLAFLPGAAAAVATAPAWAPALVGGIAAAGGWLLNKFTGGGGGNQDEMTWDEYLTSIGVPLTGPMSTASGGSSTGSQGKPANPTGDDNKKMSPEKWLQLGGAALGIAGGFMSGSKQINLTQMEPTWPQGQETFGDWLFSGFEQNESGGWDLKPLDAYPGPVNPQQNPILNELFNNWSPTDAGSEMLFNQLQGGMANPQFGQAFNDMRAYGGMAGYPLDLMHSIAQFGGTGGVGSKSMGNALRFGAPSSEASQPMQNVLATGVASEGSGGALRDRALGNPTAASGYLSQFINPETNKNRYSIPSIRTKKKGGA